MMPVACPNDTVGNLRGRANGVNWVRRKAHPTARTRPTTNSKQFEETSENFQSNDARKNRFRRKDASNGREFEDVWNRPIGNNREVEKTSGNVRRQTVSDSRRHLETFKIEWCRCLGYARRIRAGWANEIWVDVKDHMTPNGPVENLTRRFKKRKLDQMSAHIQRSGIRGVKVFNHERSGIRKNIRNQRHILYNSRTFDTRTQPVRTLLFGIWQNVSTA